MTNQKCHVDQFAPSLSEGGRGSAVKVRCARRRIVPVDELP